MIMIIKIMISHIQFLSFINLDFDLNNNKKKMLTPFAYTFHLKVSNNMQKIIS